MTPRHEATVTSATYKDYREIYGPPLIVFQLPNGRSYQWYPGKVDTFPHIILNIYDDGTATAAEVVPRHEPRDMFSL